MKVKGGGIDGPMQGLATYQGNQVKEPNLSLVIPLFQWGPTPQYTICTTAN